MSPESVASNPAAGGVRCLDTNPLAHISGTAAARLRDYSYNYNH